MNKNKVLSLFLIILLLFIPAMIINSDDHFNNLKIQYTYINSNGEVEFGEISNNQELAVLLDYGEQFVVTIWNYGNEPLNLHPDSPINIIEGQEYIDIPEKPDTEIPVGKSTSFLIDLYNFPSSNRRGVIEIVSADENDEDFEFGLWVYGHSGCGGSGSGS